MWGSPGYKSVWSTVPMLATSRVTQGLEVSGISNIELISMVRRNYITVDCLLASSLDTKLLYGGADFLSMLNSYSSALSHGIAHTEDLGFHCPSEMVTYTIIINHGFHVVYFMPLMPLKKYYLQFLPRDLRQPDHIAS